jgi:hypothetical protein
MTKYYAKDMVGLNPSDVPLLPLKGGKLAKRDRVESVMEAQDRVAAMSRRILMTAGLRGETGWMVPSGINPDSSTRTHPSPIGERRVHACRFELTPGCVLRLSAVGVPNGQTQVPNGSDYLPGGSGGIVRLKLTWHGPDGPVSTEHDIAMPSSTHPWGDIGEPWLLPRVEEHKDIRPEAYISPAIVRRWSQHCTVEAELYYVGGVRAIDVTLSEIPRVVAFADDDAVWTSHIAASAEWPVTHLGDTDPRGGTLHMMDVANAQAERLGPALISWTAWSEGTGPIGGPGVIDAQYGLELTSPTLLRLPALQDAGYDESEPGWSLSCGAYARRYAENHPSSFSGDGSIPVRVSVLASVGTGSGTVRIQAAPWSWIDVVCTETFEGEYAWFESYGHLRCGTGPGDPTVVQALASSTHDGSGETPGLLIAAIQVHYAGQWPRSV